LHPERLAQSLTARERARLHEAIQRVLASAIERRGTSLSDYVDADGEQGTNQDFLMVYGRAGQPCHREDCNTPIVRRVIAQRGTWICPTCQSLAPRRRPGQAVHGATPRTVARGSE
jgi:formamidopyrimidine-DNA glycosylase